MPEPLTPERLAEIRERWSGGVMGHQTVFELLAEVDRLRADYDRLKSGAYTQASMLREITSQCMAAELERDARLPAEDVERFLKRERDEYVKGTLVWQRLDDVLDCFRLHIVTGAPLTEPRPGGGEPRG